MKKIIVLFGLIFWGCENFTLSANEDTFFHVRISGTEIPVWVRGNTASKKLVVYINGGPGLTSLDVARADMFGWSELEGDFAMVYYDQRGTGNAQGNFDSSTLTIAQYIKDLDAIVTILKNKYDNADIILMGHSFGNFIATNYLLNADYHDKIAGWICIDGAFNFDFDLTWQYRRTFLQALVMEELSKNPSDQNWLDAQSWLDTNARIETREQKNEWRSFIGWPGEGFLPEELGELNLRQYLQIGFFSSYNPFPAYASSNLDIVNDALNKDVEGINHLESTSSITTPALFLWGKYDDLIPSQEGRVAFDNLGSNDSQFIILPNSSHEPYISAPNRFRQEVKDFVLRL